MRNGQNKRMRGRNNQHHNQHHNRKNQNPFTRVYESNGPEVKIRGTASHVAEKYIQLARDAQSSGDPVAAENYYQHAEHYLRVLAAANEQFRQNNPNMQNPQQPAQMGNDSREENYSDYEDDQGVDQPQQGGEQPQFGTRDPQPYLPRDAQFYSQGDQPQPQVNHRQPHGNQANSQYPNNQAHYAQNGPREDDGSIDRLPSFITGGQPQAAPQQAPDSGGERPYQGERGERQGGDRFGYRRRRRHRGGQRSDGPQGQMQEAGDEPN
jgi:hypothetical protein